jgi:hypothetical protein
MVSRLKLNTLMRNDPNSDKRKIIKDPEVGLTVKDDHLEIIQINSDMQIVTQKSSIRDVRKVFFDGLEPIVVLNNNPSNQRLD